MKQDYITSARFVNGTLEITKIPVPQEDKTEMTVDEYLEHSRSTDGTMPLSKWLDFEYLMEAQRTKQETKLKCGWVYKPDRDLVVKENS